jgi:hypothetical protein
MTGGTILTLGYSRTDALKQTAQITEWVGDHLPGWVGSWVASLWIAVAFLVISLVGMTLLFLLLQKVLPKITAIAWVTAKDALWQPLFTVIILFGLAALFLFLFLPYNTFGEDVGIVKSEGQILIKLLAVILAVWTASVSISDEIEGKTALMTLSKPVGRSQFILGKFLGVAIPVALVFILLGTFFLGSIAYKIVYDARESAALTPEAIQCAGSMLQVLPGLALHFMETMMLAAIAVMISTRLPMIPNMIICMTTYALGHLVPQIVATSAGEIAFVKFLGQLMSVIIPSFALLDTETANVTNQLVPMSFLLWAGLWATLYCTAVVLLSLVLFEDRDLA